MRDGGLDDADAKCLIKRNGLYYVHVRVPADIVDSYGRKFGREAAKPRLAVPASIHQKFGNTAPAMPAPSPQSFAELGRLHGRDIAAKLLRVRADLHQKATLHERRFLLRASKRYTAFDESMHFDMLVADGDLDRSVSFGVGTSGGSPKLSA